MVNRADIVAKARTYIGTRWRHQGRQPGRMIDCVGVIVKVAHHFDITQWDTLDYGRMSVYNTLLRIFEEHLIRKPIRDRKPGDIALFRERVYPVHCGIVGEKDGQLTIIHAYLKRKKVVEEPYSQEWLDSTVAMFAYPTVED